MGFLRNDENEWNWGNIAVAGIGGGLTLTTIFTSVQTLKQTEVGVDYEFGRIVTLKPSEFRQPGLSFKLPWRSVKAMDLSQQHLEIGNLETYTKDNQKIHVELTVIYRIPQDKVIEILERNPNYQQTLQSTATNAMKIVLGKNNAQDIAFNREQIIKDVTVEVEREASKLLGLEIVTTQVANFKFEQGFEQGIAQAAQAKAVLTQKQTEQQQIEVEAKTTAIKAQGDANAIKINADATAYATQKQAEAYRTLVKEIGSENVAAYFLTQKWNGQVPAVLNFGGGSAIVQTPAELLKPAAPAAKP
ncbi:MAG: SPFH domain-containing protein [Alphaproteobacteria bacterium]